MSFATSNRVQMAYVPEVTFGVTPATPTTKLIPMQSTTLDLAKEIISDPTIISDRMERYERHGNYQVNGNIVTSLQHSQFDDFIEAAMGGTWATNVLKVGSTNRSFTFEQGFLDIAQYRLFTGVRVNQWDLSVQPNGIVTSTFGLIGSSSSTSTMTVCASPTALVAAQPMTHIGATIQVAAASVKATAFTMQLTNNMAAQYGIGSSAALDVSQHMSNVTGAMTFYFEDVIAYNRFVNETTADVNVVLSDGTNTLAIDIPVAKFNSAGIPVSGSQNLFVTMNYKALWDSASSTTVKVTRSS